MYRQAPNLDGAIRLSDTRFIPIASADYAEVRAWLDAGNQLAPAEPLLASIPTTVTMRQARLALLQSGLLATVNNAVATMLGAEGDAARIEWEFSSMVERNRPLVQSLSASLGLTSAQLDDLFVLAATL